MEDSSTGEAESNRSFKNIQLVILKTFLVDIKPMVNQILLHISNTPLELVEYCQGKDIYCVKHLLQLHVERCYMRGKSQL